MVSCKIRGCKNRSDNKGNRKLHFFSFPKDEKVMAVWLAACKRPTCTRNSRVCSIHFKPSCYKPKRENGPRFGIRVLLPEAVPSEHIAPENSVKTGKKSERTLRFQKKLEEVRASNYHQFTYGKDTFEIIESLQEFVHVQVPDSQSHLSSSASSIDIQHDLGTIGELKNVGAPAHIIDHQYTAYSEEKINSQDNRGEFDNNDISPNSDCEEIIEIESETTDGLSDKEKILQLERQLKAKTLEYQKLNKLVKRLQNEKLQDTERKIHEVLKHLFSPRQINIIMNPNEKKLKWSVEDVISAFTLQNISLRAYHHLRENNYPLPGLSTIRKWATEIDVSEGILSEVFTIMKCKAKSLSKLQKIVILRLQNSYTLNENCKFGIVSSLFCKWMQLIYYSFNKPLSADLVLELAAKLHDAGFYLVAVTYDYSPTDLKAWTDLKIGIGPLQKCYFTNPKKEDSKIYVFPHTSHLLVHLRKHFMKDGFIVRNKHVDKVCLEEIIDINDQLEGEISGVITRELLDDYELDEDKISISKKFFSTSVAQEIICYGNEGFILNENWDETAIFFKQVNEWFSLFNAKVNDFEMNDGNTEDTIYQMYLEHWNNTLAEMEKIMNLTKVKGFKKVLPFKEHIILNCTTSRKLLDYIEENFNISSLQKKYIITKRLNCAMSKDIINFLSCQDSLMEPIAEFQNKLRKCLLGKCTNDSLSCRSPKLSEPCLMDFKVENSVDSDTKLNVNATETAKKVRKILNGNRIPPQKLRENILNILRSTS